MLGLVDYPAAKKRAGAHWVLLLVYPQSLVCVSIESYPSRLSLAFVCAIGSFRFLLSSLPDHQMALSGE